MGSRLVISWFLSTTPPGYPQIKLSDLGVTKLIGLFAEGALEVGYGDNALDQLDFTYMSPEQLRGEGTSARSDIYSAGVVLYELSTGQVPFTGPAHMIAFQQMQEPPPRPSELSPGVSPALEQTLLTALARDPTVRFTTAEDFKADLPRSI